MSDEDLLADDLGDHNLADYNLGNEEEEQLLADDYDTSSQNVPNSAGSEYSANALQPTSVEQFSGHNVVYNAQALPYQGNVEPECVVPNITVEVSNTPLPEHSTYAPYNESLTYEQNAVVPPAIPAAPVESPQIVPSEAIITPSDGDLSGGRDRFITERPPGVQRTPQVRDIPDSLDKVYVPRGPYNNRGRTSWRNPQFQPRYSHPYRRNNNPHWVNNFQRSSYPPSHVRPSTSHIRPLQSNQTQPPPESSSEFPHDAQLSNIRPENRQDLHPDARPEYHLVPRQDFRPEQRTEFRPEMQSDFRPENRNESRPEIRPGMSHAAPSLGSQMPPERPVLSQDNPNIGMRPPIENIHPYQHNFPPRYPHQQFRSNTEEHRRNFGPNVQPNFEPRPMYPYQRPHFNPRPFPPPVREISPNNVSHLPQVTIRQNLPGMPLPSNIQKIDESTPKIGTREPEVRMLPMPLPPALPPTGLAVKKVLINPHFKGNFQPPVEGLPSLPAYIPTRIQKTPPLSPTLENKFGPIKDIDDAAERFIAEQRNALARAAGRKFPRRSPQRYIENTTIEIENDLAHRESRDDKDDELLRRQEQFINENRAGLRRRMRSPSPVRRSPSPPRRSPERSERVERRRAEPVRGSHSDEEIEYRRRLREQENLRERVLRAKEVRRRKNAVALQKQIDERERERHQSRSTDVQKVEKESDIKPTSTEQDNRPDTTRQSPEKTAEQALKDEKSEQIPKLEKSENVERARERSPLKTTVEANSTCENLTPPREMMPKPPSPERAMTPPLPAPEKVKIEEKRYQLDSDDELDLILDDIDDILSDEEDTGRFKDRSPKKEETLKTKPQTDLRSRIPPKSSSGGVNKRERPKIIYREERDERIRTKENTTSKKPVVSSSTKIDNNKTHSKETTLPKHKIERQRITFDKKETEKVKPKEVENQTKVQAFSSRRVVLQRKVPQITTKDQKTSVFSRIEVQNDPTKPNPGIFSRAVRTAIGSDKNRLVVKKNDEPQIEYDSDSDIDEDKLLEEDVGNIALVKNLPHGMTDTRLKTLAGNDVQNLILDKEERTAKVTFKSTTAAEGFKKKFNNKMVAASRLTVILQ